MNLGKLRPLLLQLERRPGSVLRQVELALLVYGQPLRWAITAVQSSVEGAVLLQIEAVVVCTHEAESSEG